jgi:hypothetical protein
MRAFTLFSILIFAAGSASAQSDTGAAPTDIAALRDELAQLRDEVAALRAALGEIRNSVGANARPLRDRQQPSLQAAQVTPETIDMLRTQIAEQAQAKVESSSRLPVKVSGTILANTFVNTGEANWIDNPNLVGLPPSGGRPEGSTSATARQSRIGFETSGIAIGSWQASGTIIADFFGGVPGFQTGTVMGLPRLLYGFGRLQTDRTAIEVGQDHMILAPRDPTSLAALSFPLLFRAGNLYLRAPQARVEQKLGSEWTVEGGILAPIAGDTANTYDFAPPPGAGERSKRPAFQGRVGFARGDKDSEREFAAGVSGHYGWRRPATTLVDAWAVAVDFNARVSRIAAAGEFFWADNAEPFGGGISQPGRASGGWAEARLRVTPRTMVTTGFGMDRPKDALGRVLRSENRSAFGSVIFDITPEVATSLEYRWLETRLGMLPTWRENHHVNAVLAVRF